jgi:hypothetical protein
LSKKLKSYVHQLTPDNGLNKELNVSDSTATINIYTNTTYNPQYQTLNFIKEFKKENSLENPLFPLVFGIVFDVVSLFFQTLHLFILAFDGEGLFVLHVFSRIFKIIAHVIIVWLLLMISYGWTIKYKSIDEKDIYIILMLFTLMIHIMITALTFVDDDEYHKYHDFSGVQGIILVVLRFIIFFAFLYGIIWINDYPK